MDKRPAKKLKATLVYAETRLKETYLLEIQATKMNKRSLPVGIDNNLSYHQRISQRILITRLYIRAHFKDNGKSTWLLCCSDEGYASS